MDSLSDGCRLCLDPFAECFTTIENPQLKDQMEQVLRFTIEPKQGYCSGVCQSCSFTISEFYQFSEKVRTNQEFLNGNVTINDSTVNSKISLDNLNVEAFIKREVLETTEDDCEPMDEVSAEEVPILESAKNGNLETSNDSVIPEWTKNTCEPTEKVTGEEEISNTVDGDPNKPSSKKSLTERERRKAQCKAKHEEDLLFNKHFRMICNLCGISTETFSALNHHFKKEHKQNGYVVCCNKKLNRRYSLRHHIDWHADPDVFRCKVCGKKQKSRDSLNSHMLKVHSNNDQNSFKCDHCPQSFVQKSALEQHMEWHKNTKTKTTFPETVEGACELRDAVSEVEEPTLDSEITIENVKVEPLSDSEPQETKDGAYESKNEVSGEEVPTLNSEITIENVKVERHNDFELSETIADDCEPENEASEEYGFPSSGDDESFEPSSKLSQTKQEVRLGQQTDKPSLKEERLKEDLIFNKHFSMVCDLCGTSVGNFTGIVSHFWKEHNRHGYVVCCNQKLFKRINMREHLEFHTNPDVFRCKVCGIKLKNKITLTNHMFIKHSTAGSFKCDHCPESFAEESALAFHLRRHTKLKCPKCHKTFARNTSLDRHVVDCGRFACDICGKDFMSQRFFDRHMKAHSEIEVRRFRCELCHCWTKSELRLLYHMENAHRNRKFQCDICLQNYPRAKSLYQHKLSHADAKHECEFCGKKFKTNYSLQGHLASCTGEMKSGGT